jgi:hypothetical protein
VNDRPCMDCENTSLPNARRCAKCHWANAQAQAEKYSDSSVYGRLALQNAYRVIKGLCISLYHDPHNLPPSGNFQRCGACRRVEPPAHYVKCDKRTKVNGWWGLTCLQGNGTWDECCDPCIKRHNANNPKAQQQVTAYVRKHR